MCFNGAKSWELGWYNDKAMTFDPSVSTGWSGRLVGIAEHDFAEPNQGEMVLIKIETGTEEDYYINFNHQTGFNSETQEGGDQFLITNQGANGRAFAKSTLHAKLTAGGSYEMKGFGGSGFGGIAIKVNSIHLLSSPAYVSVTIGSEQEYVFLNWCGGDYYDGTNVWKADVAYVDGGNVYYPGAVSISSTTTPELYRSERYGSDLMYNIPLPPGYYDIMMHLAEIYFDNVGDRVFDVKINGSMELSDVDIVRDAGGAFKAHIKSLKSAAVTNGSLQIELNPKRQNAKLGDDCFRVIESDKTRSNVSLVVKSLKIRFRQSRFVHQEAICRQRQSRLRHLYRFPLQNRLHHPRRVPLPNRLSVPRLNRRSGHQLGRPLPTTADFDKDANDNTAWGSFQSRDGASDAVRMSRTGQQQYIHQGEAAPRISDESGVDSSVFQYQDHMSESIRTFVPVLALSSQPGKFGWIRFGALLRWRYIMERNEGLSKVTRFREWRILFFCSGIQQHWRELSADFSRSYSLPLQREH